MASVRSLDLYARLRFATTRLILSSLVHLYLLGGCIRVEKQQRSPPAQCNLVHPHSRCCCPLIKQLADIRHGSWWSLISVRGLLFVYFTTGLEAKVWDLRVSAPEQPPISQSGPELARPFDRGDPAAELQGSGRQGPVGWHPRVALCRLLLGTSGARSVRCAVLVHLYRQSTRCKVRDLETPLLQCLESLRTSLRRR